jgi:thiamine biosynthesis lipoprotein ApbE
MRIDDFERTYSRFRDDSFVAHIAAAREGGRFQFPEDSTVLFDLYDRLYKATAGAVDPLVGRSLELLGYDRTYSLTPAPTTVREAEALATEVVVGCHPRRRHGNHARSARYRRRRGRQGLSGRPRLGDAADGRS